MWYNHPVVWYICLVIIITLIFIILLSPVDSQDKLQIDMISHPIFDFEDEKISVKTFWPFDVEKIFMPVFEYIPPKKESVLLIYLQPSQSYFVKNLSLAKNDKFKTWYPTFTEIELLDYLEYVKSKTNLPVELWIRRKSVKLTKEEWKSHQVYDFDSYFTFETFHPRSLIYLCALASKSDFVHYVQLGVEIETFLPRLEEKTTFITTHNNVVDPFWMQMKLDTDKNKDEIFTLAQIVEDGKGFMPEKYKLIEISESKNSKPILEDKIEVGRRLEEDMWAHLEPNSFKLNTTTLSMLSTV